MSLLLQSLSEAAPASSDFDLWAWVVGGFILLGLIRALRPVARTRRRVNRQQSNVFRRPPL